MLSSLYLSIPFPSLPPPGFFACLFSHSFSSCALELHITLCRFRACPALAVPLTPDRTELPLSWEQGFTLVSSKVLWQQVSLLQLLPNLAKRQLHPAVPGQARLNFAKMHVLTLNF